MLKKQNFDEIEKQDKNCINMRKIGETAIKFDKK